MQAIFVPKKAKEEEEEREQGNENEEEQQSKPLLLESSYDASRPDPQVARVSNTLYFPFGVST